MGSFYNFVIKNMTVLKWHGLKNPKGFGPLECGFLLSYRWSVSRCNIVVRSDSIRRGMYRFETPVLNFFGMMKTTILEKLYNKSTSIQLPFPFLWLQTAFQTFGRLKKRPDAPCTQRYLPGCGRPSVAVDEEASVVSVEGGENWIFVDPQQPIDF